MHPREEINCCMKYFYAILCLISASVSFAQESLEPIGFQKRGHLAVKLKSTATFDSTFVYTFDTLQLPIFDEFSSSKFQDLTAVPGAPNVSEQLFHRLLDVSNNPLPANAAYTATVTKLKTYSNGLLTETDLPATTIKVGSLAAYPVAYGSQVVYPPYFIYDTLDFPNDPDTVFIFQPEFTQDSARLFTAHLADQDAIWTDYYAYRNFTHAKDPWTLGVVTFDGLDENGYPYNFGTASVGYADFLTSKTIDLSGFAPNDSIYLSFLVQPEGLGDEPEQNDSLVLEFYNAGQDDWERVWSLRGSDVTDFKVGHIRITQNAYLTAGFRFRFKNYGGLSGMLDEFHLDYVHLRSGSGYQDTLFKDFAFVYPLGSLIETYTQVPWDHWVNDPTHMNGNVKATVRNGSNVAENNINGTVAVQVAGTTEGTFTMIGQTLSGGNINYAPRTVYESYHDFSGGYVFSTTAVEEKTFDVIATASAPFPNFTGNDTSYTQQHFGSEYAYDDGSAEAAYGITGAQARLAYRFVPYEADTLIGVNMHFVPSVNDVSNKLFLLTVWADNAGQPGAVLYEDDFLYPRQPVYEDDRGIFTTYYLNDSSLALPNAPFYIGWRQIDLDRLNIGFDRNNDQSGNTFYSLNGGASWIGSSLEGAMMMRPVFSTAANASLSVTESKLDLDWVIYPNPAMDEINLRWDKATPFYGMEVLDQFGKVVAYSNELSASIQHLAKGVYFVRAVNYPAVKTLIKQ